MRICWIISQRKDRNAYNFLYCYFMKVMSDSGFMKYFEEYAKDSVANPVAARDEIYERYYRLINGNTPSHSRLDIRRMFHKVFNVYAAEHHCMEVMERLPIFGFDVQQEKLARHG